MVNSRPLAGQSQYARDASNRETARLLPTARRQQCDPNRVDRYWNRPDRQRRL